MSPDATRADTCAANHDATWAADLLSSLRVPVVSAPMAGAAGGALSAAVTRAGGLGTLGFGSAVTPADIERESEIARAAGDFGIGLMLWVVRERPEILEAALAQRPALLSLSFGDPSGPIDRARAAGVVTACQVGTLEEARRALDAGADVLIARGSEGGGHGRGEVASLPLLQQVLALVDEQGAAQPVLAAGGIGTARGVAAALAAGADGVWVGTPFAACAESAMPTEAKAAIIGADAAQTVYTRAFDVAQRFSWPREYGGRAIANDFSDSWAHRVGDLEEAVAADDAVTEAMRAARLAGDARMAPVYAGQSAGLVTRERSAADVIEQLAGFRPYLAAAARRWQA